MRSGAVSLLFVFCWLLPGLDIRFRAEVVPALDARLAVLQDFRPPTLCRVFDEDGQPFDAFAIVRREWVPLAEVPDVVWKAVVAAEDRRFFRHHGVDVLGILRAAVVNLQAGRIKEGGSTLTQQLVKNLVVGSDRSFLRKAEEALLAWRLEDLLGKERVLELYLNYIYLGSGNYGVAAAARDYFGVEIEDVDVGQAALLAGLIPAPSASSPRRSQSRARDRRRLVLDAMVETGFIDVIDAQQAKADPIDPPRRGDGTETIGTSFRTAVRREVRRLLGEEAPFDAGLQIFTAYRADIQAVAEQAVRDAASGVERRQGHPGPLTTLDAAGVGRFVEGSAGGPALGEGDCGRFLSFGGRELVRGTQRAGWAAASLDRKVRNPHPEESPRLLRELLRYGQVWEVCLDARGEAVLRDTPWVEAAAVVIRRDSGEVAALVGGRDMPLEGFNRATQGLRQAGSAFKPFVYGAALEAGRSQLDDVLDAPLALPAGGGRVWSPQNYGGGFSGRVPMRVALARSLNTVAVRLALETGTAPIVRLARDAGIRTPLRDDLTLALGSSEVSVLDMAVAYGTFARMGEAIPPVFVRRLEDVDGREVGRAGETVRIEGVQARLPGPPGVTAMKPATAWQVIDMLRGVVSRGTGRSAFVEGLERGGKTGTTSNYIDAWFVGFTASHVIAVWVGADARTPLGYGETGGRAALPAWRAIADALAEPRGAELVPPPDVVLLPYDGAWVGVSAQSPPVGQLVHAEVGSAPLPPFPAKDSTRCLEVP